jgi:hypothetical protein
VGNALDRKGPGKLVTLDSFLVGNSSKGPNGIIQAAAFEHRGDRKLSFLVPRMEMSEIKLRSFDTIGT